MVQARALGVAMMATVMMAAGAMLAACSGPPGEVTLVQRNEAPAPLVGGGVRLYLGDVSGGASAEVRVLGPGTSVLAEGHLLRGGELGFTHGGRPWTVIAVGYKDYLIDDEGTLRIEQRPATADQTLVRVPQRGAAPLPGAPGVMIAIDDIVGGNATTVTITDGGGAVLGTHPVRTGEVVAFGVGGTTYLLEVEAFEDHAVDTDYAYLRVLPR